MNVNIQLRGDFQRRLEQFARDLPELVEDVMKEACDVVVAKAKQEAPVDQSHLKGSITRETVRQGSKITGVVYTNEQYAPYVHFGTGIYATNGGGRQTPWKYIGTDGKVYTTKGQKSQPFLQDALDQSINEVQNKFRGLLG